MTKQDLKQVESTTAALVAMHSADSVLSDIVDELDSDVMNAVYKVRESIEKAMDIITDHMDIIADYMDSVLSDIVDGHDSGVLNEVDEVRESIEKAMDIITDHMESTRPVFIAECEEEKSKC